MSEIPPPQVARIERDIRELSSFRDETAPGWTRRVFSEPYSSSRSWIVESMRRAGLSVEIDPVCNIVGTLTGSGRSDQVVVSGSHTDTVRGGGRFDGIIGVLGAIEAARLLTEGGQRLPCDLRIVDFTGEEPNDFGLSCVGSRAVSGSLRREHLDLQDANGRTLADALTDMGGDPDAALEMSWETDNIAGFVELHIEQGPTLERSKVPIGVVTGIVGIHRLVAEFHGRPDHAGTTPMHLRRDALCAAAEAVLAMEVLPRGDAVATTGRLDVEPGASNVVPALARIGVEFRDLDSEWLSQQHSVVEETLTEIAHRRGLDVRATWSSDEAPVAADPRLVETIERSAFELGHETLRLPSGAGHDAVMMADISPVGMIFVPSAGGRSHCPEEWTDGADISKGVHVLARSIVDLAG